VPLAREIFNPLDSGLRRNDSLLSNGLSGINKYVSVIPNSAQWSNGFAHYAPSKRAHRPVIPDLVLTFSPYSHAEN